MDAAHYIATFGLPLAVFGFAVLSGIVPVLNCEIFLLGLAVAKPDSDVAVVALLAAAGQMLAKALMYGAGVGVLRLPGRRLETALARVHAQVERMRGNVGALVLVSATVGLPPFYVVTVASGVARYPFGLFMALGFAGRFLRFAAVLLSPQAVRWLIP